MLIPTDRKQPCQENIQHYRSMDIVPITIPYVFQTVKSKMKFEKQKKAELRFYSCFETKFFIMISHPLYSHVHYMFIQFTINLDIEYKMKMKF